MRFLLLAAALFFSGCAHNFSRPAESAPSASTAAAAQNLSDAGKAIVKAQSSLERARSAADLIDHKATILLEGYQR